ncbi:glycosyltransferase family 2 protein [Silanimonas sp.]|uniref:glycosyltransferase family 2 protein n=1 Tax=Silanimonas sp. TaxID=1929290 RepID=UPI0022BD05B4|nr:glycosyltransferase family 2 protein [Silanimonas sp.]MCZ8164346.1 glycosyltransferase family 2 protein [Silanimonas sp.]
MNPNAVDAVVVSYDSASTIDACLRALLVQPELASVRVVDNGSRDDTVRCVEAMAAGDPRIVLIRQPGNPGFAAGCNAGALAVALGEPSPWLLFVNPDVELPAGALARLLAHAAALSRCGAFGADLRDADGRRDTAARRRDLSLWQMVLAAGRRGALDVEPDDMLALQPVDACSGALMLVPRAAFDAIGGWDTGYRLHVEDLDFCRRLRAAGFVVAVANDVPVLHHRGVSSRARPFFVEWHKHRGLWRYWWRFEARGAAIGLAPLVLAALAARLVLLAWPLAALRLAQR